MSVILETNWWSIVIRGLTALALGAITVIWREISLRDLTLLFFGYAMIDGVVNLAGAVSAAQANERWGSLVFEALTGIGAALLAVSWPGITIIELAYIIAAWGLATGALEMASAVRLRRHVLGERLLALSGAASIALGLVMVATALAWTSALALWLGVYAFVFGALLVALGLRLRARFGGRREPEPQPIS